eukprot:scaffold250323_cov41-Prasinocladus_malaysianus.AAC.1
MPPNCKKNQSFSLLRRVFFALLTALHHPKLWMAKLTASDIMSSQRLKRPFLFSYLFSSSNSRACSLMWA